MTTEAFDVIVLDVMLPGRDGLPILTTLRSRGVKTPVLVLTARHDEDAYRATIGSMLEEVDRLAYLVDRLLTLSAPKPVS